MDCMGLQRVRHDFHFHFTVKFTFNVQLRTEFKFQCIFYIVKYSPMILLDFQEIPKNSQKGQSIPLILPCFVTESQTLNLNDVRFIFLGERKGRRGGRVRELVLMKLSNSDWEFNRSLFFNFNLFLIGVKFHSALN